MKMNKKYVLYLLLCISSSFALDEGPYQPDYLEFEETNLQDMVDLKTGNFAYQVPLGDLPSPYGSYPLAISYHAGVTPQQEATWVGLGWSLNPGAISRAVRGVPDDLYNGSVISFSNISADRRAWMFGIGYARKNIQVKQRFYSDGRITYSFTAGFAVNDNLTVGFTVGTDGQGFSMANSDGQGFDVWQSSSGETTSLRTSFGNSCLGSTQCGVGLTVSGDDVSFSGYAGDASLTAGNKGVSLSVGPSRFDFSNTTSKGENSSMKADFHFSFTTSYGTFSGEYQQSRYRYVSKSATSEGLFGYIYQAGSAIDVAKDNTSNENAHGALVGDIETYRDLYEKGARLETVLGGENMPGYDIYNISAEGMSGSFRPYARESHSLHEEIKDVKNNQYGDVFFPMYPGNLKSPWGDRDLASDTEYDVEYKDYSYCLRNGIATEDAANACSVYGKYKSEYYNEGNRLVYNSNDGAFEERGGMRFVFLDNGGYYESVNDAKSLLRKDVSSELLSRKIGDFSYALYGARKIKPLFEKDNPTGKLAGFEVTASNGTRYIYKQPVMSYMQVDYTINSAVGGPVVVDGVESYPDSDGNLVEKIINFMTGGAYEDIKEFGLYDLFVNDDKTKLNDVTKQAGIDVFNFIPVFVESNIIPSTLASTFVSNVFDSFMGSNEMEDACSDNDTKKMRSSYRVDVNPYATQWLLSEIRGSDYVDIPNEANPVGYYVKFSYTDPSLYFWRTPYAKPGVSYADLPNYRNPRNANVPQGCDPRLFSASFGVKENVYLSKIETATHEVVFKLNDAERVDGKGWEYSDGVTTPIFFKAHIAFDLEKTSTNQKKNEAVYTMKPKYLYLNTPLPEYMKNVSSLNKASLVVSAVKGANKVYRKNASSDGQLSVVKFPQITQVAFDSQNLEAEMDASDYKYGSYKYRLKDDVCSESGNCSLTLKSSDNLSRLDLIVDEPLVVGVDGELAKNILFNLVDYVMSSPKMSNYDNQARYLEKISYRNKANPNNPYREYLFNYDYSLQPKSVNSYCLGKYPSEIDKILMSPDSVGIDVCNSALTEDTFLYGKLTLKSITEKGCLNGKCRQLPPYKFDYAASNASAFRYGDQASWKAFVAGSSVGVGNVESVEADPEVTEAEKKNWEKYRELGNKSEKLVEFLGPFAGSGVHELSAGARELANKMFPKNSDIGYPGVSSVAFGYGDALDDVDASFMSTADAVDEYGFWSYKSSPANHVVNQDFADYGGAAWSLNKVTDPAGGVVEIEYERDNYHDVDYYGDNYNLFPVKGFKDCGGKLCLELQPLYWVESCSGTESAYWSENKPKDSDEDGFEYLNLLKQDNNDYLMYSLYSRMSTEEWRCGNAISRFFRHTCHANRNVAILGDAKTSFTLLKEGGRVFLETDRNYDEILSGLDRAARKYAQDTAFKSDGSDHKGYIWLKKNYDVFKGGDIRVSRVTKYDVNYKIAMNYKYSVGELAQLIDSTFNPVLVNRFAQDIESYVLPDMYLKPKSRVVGIGDDDLSMLPGSQVIYPQVSIQNTVRDEDLVKNGKKEFFFISPEKGVPAEFIDGDLRKKLKPFIALNLKYFNLERQSNDSLLRGRYFQVGLENNGAKIGRSYKTVLFDDVNKTLYFYLDSNQIKNVTHAWIRAFDDNYQNGSKSTIQLNDLAMFNEYQIAVALKHSEKKAKLTKLWDRHQENGYFPITYKYVDFERTNQNFIEAVTRGPIKYENALKNGLIKVTSYLAPGTDGYASALFDYFDKDKSKRRMPSAFNNVELDFESSVVYHDLTSFVGQPYKVVEYRGPDKKMIVSRVDSTILSTRAPDLLENVVAGQTSESSKKLGVKREKWRSNRVMSCDSVNCIMKNYDLYLNKDHRSVITYEHVRYPVFSVGLKSYIGYDAIASQSGMKTTKLVTTENHRFDPVSGNPTASLTSVKMNNDSLVRKLTQMTPHYIAYGDRALSDSMFVRNMLDQNYMEEVYFDTVRTTGSVKPGWESIKQNNNLIGFNISPYLEMDGKTYNNLVQGRLPIVSIGSYSNKAMPVALRSNAMKYQNASGGNFPSLQEYSGKNITKINNKYKVEEISDVHNQSLATIFSPDGMFQMNLTYPAKFSDVAVVLPYNGSFYASEQCVVTNDYASCSIDTHEKLIAEYRLCKTHQGCESKREELSATSFRLELNGKELNYLRIYPENAESKTYIYDAFGHLIQFVSEQNLSTFYEYDALGNLIQIRNEDGVSFKSHHREYMNNK